jgi:hypothetical protein
MEYLIASLFSPSCFDFFAVITHISIFSLSKLLASCCTCRFAPFYTAKTTIYGLLRTFGSKEFAS